MKKFTWLTFLLAILFINPSSASHIKGGEITWECQGNGNFAFTLILYRDCSSIALYGTSQSLSTTVPGLAFIPLNFITIHDLTPSGCGNSCANPNGLGGSTEEWIFKSNPINLNGVPPVGGWIFRWDNECCLNPNINWNPGGWMGFHSIMYSIPGTGSTNPCFDSSPRFIVPPTFIVCVGYDFVENQTGFDNDFDSLTYAFDNTYGGNYAAPFTVSNPIPGNPHIDASTGVFNVSPPNGSVIGNYVMVIRVTSYRCGIKTAEVFRQYEITLSATACPSVINSGWTLNNSTPQVSNLPFISNIDTINVGDTVFFTQSVGDLDQSIPSLAFQQFTIDAFGAEMDSQSVSPFNNCVSPPCAYLDSPTPQGPFQLTHSYTFTWVTDCNHDLAGCNGEYTSHKFIINVKDDGCANPAVKSQLLTVVIRGLRIYRYGDTLIANIHYPNLQWYLNGNIITGALGDTMITTNQGGIYTAQTLLGTGCLLTSNEINIVHVNSNEIIPGFANLAVFPNPATDNLTVQLPANSSKTEIKIVNMLDELVFSSTLNTEKTIIDISGLMSGAYIVQIATADKISRQKLIRH